MQQLFFLKENEGIGSKLVLVRSYQLYLELVILYSSKLFRVLVIQSVPININKQIVSIADENFTDHSFLSRYHYTKSKNYLKRRYRIHH